MLAERRITEATRNLKQFVDARPVPAPPQPSVSREPRTRLIVGLAAMAMVVLAITGGWVVRPQDSPEELIVSTKISFPGIIPLEEWDQWTYDVTDVLADRPLGDLVVVPEDLPATPDAAGAVSWPVPLFEPWRLPDTCSEAAPILLPTLAELDDPGRSTQEVRASCEGRELVGAANVTWGAREEVSVPAGTFSTVRIDIDVTGFADPFPVVVSLWVDPSVGVVLHEAIGVTPGPVRHVRAELTGVS